MTHTADHHHPQALDAAAAELAAAVAAMQFTVDASQLLLLSGARVSLSSPPGCAAVRRRARSLSPQRRSPKLRHTNGRLDEDPQEAAVSAEEARARNAATGLDDDSGVCTLLSEEELLHVIQQPTQTDRRRYNRSVTRRAMRQRCESHSFPTRKDVRRSSSCLEAERDSVNEPLSHGERGETTAVPTPRRFKVYYRDEALRESCAKNTRRMIENARRVRSSPPESPAATAAVSLSHAPQQSATMSNQQQIARRALRYRKLLARTEEIDDSRLNDPSFDVLACLGVQWCKV